MGNLDAVIKLATNSAKKFTHILPSNNGARELILSHHINQEATCRNLTSFANGFASLFQFYLYDRVNVPKALCKGL